MKVEIALLEKGLPFERVEVGYSAADGYRAHHPEVDRVNPKGQVRVLAYAVIYVAGIPWLRTLVWLSGLAGIIMVLLPLL